MSVRFYLKKSFQSSRGFTSSEKPSRASERGFSLSEVLSGTAIFAIIGISILGTINLFVKFSQQAKDKIQAQNLAHQKIEFIRNLPYDDVATVAGAIYPPGNLPDQENITIDGTVFKVYTSISYVDDPFDGNAEGTIPGKPQDFWSYDYKKITITGRDNNNKFLAQTSTNMAAKAAETASNTGILSLRVDNSVGDPVAGAAVHVTNPNQVPPVDINTFTDITGLVQIPNLPPSSDNDYHVEVSLGGYGTDSTNPAFPPDNLNPVQPDFNILVQQITSVTLSIDVLGSMQVTVTDTSGSAVTGLTLNVLGDKLTYTAPDTHKFNQNLDTDGVGVVNVSNVETDSYSISVPSGYYIVSTAPYQKVSVPSGGAVNVSMVITTDSSHPTVSTMMPASGVNNSTVDFVITGTNLPTGTTVVLRLSGQADIAATGVTSASGDTELTGTFDLTGVQTGTWDLIVTDPSVRVVTQVGGFV